MAVGLVLLTTSCDGTLPGLGSAQRDHVTELLKYMLLSAFTSGISACFAAQVSFQYKTCLQA